MKLSVVQATRNEESNIVRNLESIKDMADEIIIVDENSTDKTRDIAEKFGAKIYLEPHHDIFHVTKQKAIDYATGDWIFQMDTDEVVTPELASEIKRVVNSERVEVIDPAKKRLFEKHQALLEKRDGKIGKEDGEIVAYFIPRLNIFLGKPLRHAGVYPDGVIRLFKKGKARLPGKSVHEQMQVDGKVGWLNGDLLHYDSPTLKRYLSRLNRYTDLFAEEYKKQRLSKSFFNFVNYVIIKPKLTFLSLYFRHKGFMDGAPGFLWSFFSACRFPIAYFKYITDNKSRI
jgi:glycosyltransferase involved in cell wall biosynthesis